MHLVELDLAAPLDAMPNAKDAAKEAKRRERVRLVLEQCGANPACQFQKVYTSFVGVL